MLITRNHSTFSKPVVTQAELDQAKATAEQTLRTVCADGVVTAAEVVLLDRSLDALVAAEAASRGLAGQDVNYSFTFETRAPVLSGLALRMTAATPKEGRDYLIKPGDSWPRILGELLKDVAPFTASAFKAAGHAEADLYAAILKKNGLPDGNAVGVGAILKMPTAAEVSAFKQAALAARAAELTPGASYRVKDNESAFSLAAELVSLHPVILGGLDPSSPATVAAVAQAIVDANPQLPGFSIRANQSVINLPDAAAIARAPTPNPMAGRAYVVAPGDLGVSVLALKLMRSDPAFASKTQAQVERAIVKLNSLGNAANPILVLGARLRMPTLAEVI